VLVEKGLVDGDALAARTGFFAEHPDAAPDAAFSGPPAQPASRSAVEREVSFRRPAQPERFAVGDAVVTRNDHPRGHTRLPRYARGRRGVVVARYGTQVFADTSAHGLGEQPQPLYCVRFEARELWGSAASATEAIHIDLWESYLRPADEGAHG
jgi:nitrile hydratase